MAKAGIIWLIIAVGLGTLGSLSSAGYIDWTNGAFRMAIWHTLAVGWLTQLIFAVSLWMFPGVRKRSKQQEGKVPWEWIIFGLLNIGVAMRLTAQPAAYELGVFFAGAFQWLAMVLYAVRVWPSTQAKRVRS
jgi:hypothetical protein